MCPAVTRAHKNEDKSRVTEGYKHSRNVNNAQYAPNRTASAITAVLITVKRAIKYRKQAANTCKNNTRVTSKQLHDETKEQRA